MKLLKRNEGKIEKSSVYQNVEQSKNDYYYYSSYPL